MIFCLAIVSERIIFLLAYVKGIINRSIGAYLELIFWVLPRRQMRSGVPNPTNAAFAFDSSDVLAYSNEIFRPIVSCNVSDIDLTV